jgi:hypothetical protein
MPTSKFYEVAAPRFQLLTVNNTKTLKSIELGYLTAILHLQPSKTLCPFSSPGCFESCLNTAGMGKFTNVQLARAKRSEFYHNDTLEFFKLLRYELTQFVAYAKYIGLKPCVRLNGTSDIILEKKQGFKNLLKEFHSVQFYDYTKVPGRDNLPKNYHLTFSRSETNESQCLAELKRGNNVAVVFDRLPTTWHGYMVICGDNDDLRFLDPKNVVIGLTAKGKAKKDLSGFVVKTLIK